MWNWIKNLFKQTVTILIARLKKSALDFINDEEVHAAAYHAALAAANRGLKGEKAWVQARNELVAVLKKKGWELKDNLVDFVLQRGVVELKNQE